MDGTTSSLLDVIGECRHVGCSGVTRDSIFSMSCFFQSSRQKKDECNCAFLNGRDEWKCAFCCGRVQVCVFFLRRCKCSSFFLRRCKCAFRFIWTCSTVPCFFLRRVRMCKFVFSDSDEFNCANRSDSDECKCACCFFLVRKQACVHVLVVCVIAVLYCLTEVNVCVFCFARSRNVCVLFCFARLQVCLLFCTNASGVRCVFVGVYKSLYRPLLFTVHSHSPPFCRQLAMG